MSGRTASTFIIHSLIMALTFATGMTMDQNMTAETAANWAVARISGSGQAPSSSLDASIYKQGAASMAAKIANASTDACLIYDYYTDHSNAVLNLNTGNRHILLWVLCTSISALQSQANGGLYIILQSSAETGTTAPTKYAKFYIGGSDTYKGGWIAVLIDGTKTPSSAVGGWVASTDLAITRRIGVGISTSASVPTIKAENLYVDAIRYGKPLYQVVGDGSAAAGWSDLLAHSQANPDTGLITMSVAAAAKTYTRTAGGSGNFITDGFVAGQTITMSGFTNAGNNGVKTVSTVSATVLTMSVSTGLVNETGNADERAQINNGTEGNGLIADLGGAYSLSAGVRIGDSAQAAATTFLSNVNRQIIFKRHTYYQAAVVDAVDYANVYVIDGDGAASFKTSITFGTVVGSGDSRQGVLGGAILSPDTTNLTYKMDFQTNKAKLSAVKLYGLTMSGAKGGILFDNDSGATETDVISCQFINSGEIDPGTTGNGATILNCALIDPNGGTAANRGMIIYATHNVSRLSCITSGSPATQHMVRLPSSGTYTVQFPNIVFFGDYSSSTLWHGEASAGSAVITVSATGTANPNAAEFDKTGVPTPSVTVSNDKVITVFVKDTAVPPSPIGNARVAIYKTSDMSEITNQLTDVTYGKVTASFNYVSDTDVTIRIRKSSPGTTRYFPFNTSGTITTNGLTLTVILIPDAISAP